MQICYYQGQFIPESQAKVSCFDRGFLLADGLFETIRCYQGKPFAISAHWQRLRSGAEQLQIPLTLSEFEWKSLLHELLAANQLLELPSGSRITITRGSGQRGLTPPSSPSPTILMTAFPIAISPLKALRLTLTSYVRNEFSPLNCFKSLNYLDHIGALQQALHQGFDDAVILNTRGFVCCSSSANLFIVKKGEIYTPAIIDGALPGITRQYVLKAAADLSIRAYETQVQPEDLHSADEIFLTNSLREIQTVGQFEKTIFNLGENKISQVLSQSLQALTAV